MLKKYEVKPTAEWDPHPDRMPLGDAFRYRRCQLVRAQKWGKSPFAAALITVEAVGPALFRGWARGGEVYRCSDYGCGCGFTHEYLPGEAMGHPWSTPLIQITASTEEQVENTYDALRPMIELGPLSEVIPRTGEEFIRLPNGGRIDAVSPSRRGRLGQRVTYVLQDETGLYTEQNGLAKVARTQRRGAAAFGGRVDETTNAWDPAEGSIAQKTYESTAPDIYRDFRQPPEHLRFHVKAERRKILEYNYADAPWSLRNLDSIMAEADELMAENPAEAERFFGNRIVAGDGSWIAKADYVRQRRPQDVPDGTKIVLGFDGSESDDWTVIQAETLDGYSFTPILANGRPSYWNPDDHGGQIPRLEVEAAIEEIFDRWDVVLGYFDPPYWSTEIAHWQERYGKRVIPWATYRPVAIHAALVRFKTDTVTARTLWHDGDPRAEDHVANAIEAPRKGGRYVIEKASDQQKIDLAMGRVLAHEAAADAIARGLGGQDEYAYYV